jgi:uncharacterized C2H2 Zn-finger protein
MKNISNQEIRTEDCTQCPNCGERGWYVMECDCGFKFCQYCSAEHDEEGDNIYLRCPKCGKFMMYV